MLRAKSTFCSTSKKYEASRQLSWVLAMLAMLPKLLFFVDLVVAAAFMGIKLLLKGLCQSL